MNSGQAIPPRTIYRILCEAGLILLAAVIAGILANHFYSDGIAVPPQPSPVATRAPAVLSSPKMIDVETASQWFDNGSAIFIDARDKYGFAENHVPGAIHLDVLDADTWMMDIYRRLPQDGRIITYSEGDTDESALRLAERLSEIGFKNVYCLDNGWQGWLDRGLPVSDALTAVPGLDR
ncbi:MAG: rhodanese-like domain-containing protein [Pseudomonadota bacterium]